MKLYDQKFQPWKSKDNQRIVASESAWKRVESWQEQCIENWRESHRQYLFGPDQAEAKSSADNRSRVLIDTEFFEDWTGDKYGDGAMTCRRTGEELSVNGNGHVWPYGWPSMSDGDDWGVRFYTMADVRTRTFNLIDNCPNLDWIIRTRELDNVLAMWPNVTSDKDLGGHGVTCSNHRTNITLFATIHTQAEADAMIPQLLKLSELCRVGVHVVPWERIDLRNFLPFPVIAHCPFCGGKFRTMGYHENDVVFECDRCAKQGYEPRESFFRNSFQQITIAGDDKPLDVDWVRDLIRQGADAGVPVWVERLAKKNVDNQNGWRTWPDGTIGTVSTKQYRRPVFDVNVFLKDKHGADSSEWAEDLRVFQWGTV